MLSRLVLRDFRCFPGIALDPGPAANFFVGANAQGKTSILEAVCILLRLQSPRARTMREVVRHHAPSFQVDGLLDDLRLSCTFQSRRRLQINGAEPASTAEYLACGRVVWFGNRDLDLVSGRGESRRRYLDFLGQQLDPAYRKALGQYKRALVSRNALLKEPTANARAQCRDYDELLASRGDYLRLTRSQMIERLNLAAAEAHAAIGAAEQLQLRYQPSGESETLLEDLQHQTERDFRLGQTSVGPHRDELLLQIEGQPAAKFASEGQQRTIALALKCAQQRLLESLPGPSPILLLDDIFGELDLERRRALLRYLPAHAPMWITATHLDWTDGLPSASRIWHVAGGEVSAG